ncbi:hypothetical protein RA224_09300 [Achromobacter aegrifaciens]|uniref:hypothetical protein n=1 Tax=Achromobacter aegrifaciens TaxID=1287736 RepID=UPI0027B9E86F|nr:hypothetical protein [Achromobacter aegrifaciens]WLW63597.1 hypothetical protein RA224_09300 [Achromobacter aegrifaciens]
MCSKQANKAVESEHRLVSLYTLSNCAESEQTRQALVNLGISFLQRSAADLSRPASPLVAAIVNGHSVAWRGHRPDMIELLADLLELGPVAEGGLADLEQADEAVLTRLQVLGEIDRHQLDHQDFYDDCGDHPLYRGSALLNWLGY